MNTFLLQRQSGSGWVQVAAGGSLTLMALHQLQAPKRYHQSLRFKQIKICTSKTICNNTQAIDNWYYSHCIKCLRISVISLFSLLSRIPGLKLCSSPTAHFPVMLGYQHLQMFCLHPNPPIPSSPSSPVFLFLRPPPRPASTGLSLFLSSCVSRIHTGGQCQPATTDQEEKVIWRHISRLHPCRGNFSNNLFFSLRGVHQSWDSQSCTLMVKHVYEQTGDVS